MWVTQKAAVRVTNQIHRKSKTMKGKAISRKHADRNFNYKNYPDRYDEARMKDNVYRKYYFQEVKDLARHLLEEQAKEEQLEQLTEDITDEQVEELLDSLTFDEYETLAYEALFRASCEAQNARNIERRHPERNKNPMDLLNAEKTAPQRMALYLGNMDEYAPRDIQLEVYTEFIEWFDNKFDQIKCLDFALHCDEMGAIHGHFAFITCGKDKDGNWTAKLNDGLAQMGIQRPDPDAPRTDENCPLQTFTRMTLEKLWEIAEAHGIEINKTPDPDNKSKGRADMTTDEYITLNETKKRNAELEAERDAIAAERDAAVAERDTAISERDAAVAEKDTAIAERDAAVADRDKQLVLLSDAKAEVTEMKAELIKTADEIKALNEWADELEVKNEEMAKKNRVLEDQTKQLENDKKAALEDVDALGHALGKMQKDMTAVGEALNELNKANNAIRENPMDVMKNDYAELRVFRTRYKDVPETKKVETADGVKRVPTGRTVAEAVKEQSKQAKYRDLAIRDIANVFNTPRFAQLRNIIEEGYAEFKRQLPTLTQRIERWKNLGRGILEQQNQIQVQQPETEEIPE